MEVGLLLLVIFGYVLFYFRDIGLPWAKHESHDKEDTSHYKRIKMVRILLLLMFPFFLLIAVGTDDGIDIDWSHIPSRIWGFSSILFFVIPVVVVRLMDSDKKTKSTSDEDSNTMEQGMISHNNDLLSGKSPSSDTPMSFVTLDFWAHPILMVYTLVIILGGATIALIVGIHLGGHIIYGMSLGFLVFLGYVLVCGLCLYFLYKWAVKHYYGDNQFDDPPLIDMD